METAIVQSFADGDYRFWLPMPRVIAAEREMDGSLLALFYDLGQALAEGISGNMVLASGSPARLRACHAVIRNALCGGGEGRVGGDDIAVGDALAKELVETYCYPARPMMHDLDLTWRILRAAVYGVDMSQAGSKKKAGEAVTTSPS